MVPVQEAREVGRAVGGPNGSGGGAEQSLPGAEASGLATNRTTCEMPTLDATQAIREPNRPGNATRDDSKQDIGSSLSSKETNSVGATEQLAVASSSLSKQQVAAQFGEPERSTASPEEKRPPADQMQEDQQRVSIVHSNSSFANSPPELADAGESNRHSLRGNVSEAKTNHDYYFDDIDDVADAADDNELDRANRPPEEADELNQISRRAHLLDSLGVRLAANPISSELKRLRQQGTRLLAKTKRKKARGRRRRKRKPPLDSAGAGPDEAGGGASGALGEQSQAPAPESRLKSASALIKSMQTRQGSFSTALPNGQGRAIDQQQQRQQQRQLLALQEGPGLLNRGQNYLPASIQKLLQKNKSAGTSIRQQFGRDFSQKLLANGANKQQQQLALAHPFDFSATSAAGGGGDALVGPVSPAVSQHQLAADSAMALDDEQPPASAFDEQALNQQQQHQQQLADLLGATNQLPQAQWPPAAPLSEAGEQEAGAAFPVAAGFGSSAASSDQLPYKQLSSGAAAAGNRLIPIEIIGLDPAVAHSILDTDQGLALGQPGGGGRGQRQMLEPPGGLAGSLAAGKQSPTSEASFGRFSSQAAAAGSNSEESTSFASDAEQPPHADHHHHQINSRQPQGPSSVFHFHHFHHTQPSSKQPAPASDGQPVEEQLQQQQQQQSPAAGPEESEPQTETAAAANQSADNAGQQSNTQAVPQQQQQQVAVNEKGELVYLQQAGERHQLQATNHHNEPQAEMVNSTTVESGEHSMRPLGGEEQIQQQPQPQPPAPPPPPPYQAEQKYSPTSGRQSYVVSTGSQLHAYGANSSGTAMPYRNLRRPQTLAQDNFPRRGAQPNQPRQVLVAPSGQTIGQLQAADQASLAEQAGGIGGYPDELADSNRGQSLLMVSYRPAMGQQFALGQAPGEPIATLVNDTTSAANTFQRQQFVELLQAANNQTLAGGGGGGGAVGEPGHQSLRFAGQTLRSPYNEGSESQALEQVVASKQLSSLVGQKLLQKLRPNQAALSQHSINQLHGNPLLPAAANYTDLVATNAFNQHLQRQPQALLVASQGAPAHLAGVPYANVQTIPVVATNSSHTDRSYWPHNVGLNEQDREDDRRVLQQSLSPPSFNQTTYNAFWRHHQQQQQRQPNQSPQHLVDNLTLLRQLQQAANGAHQPDSSQAGRLNGGLVPNSRRQQQQQLLLQGLLSPTKLSGEQSRALINQLRLNAGGQSNAAPLPVAADGTISVNNGSTGHANNGAAAAADHRFELASASDRPPPKTMRNQAAAAAGLLNYSLGGANSNSTSQQQSRQRPPAPLPPLISNNLKVNKDLTTNDWPNNVLAVRPAANESSSISFDSTGNIALAFIFVISLLTFVLITASMIYRRRCNVLGAGCIRTTSRSSGSRPNGGGGGAAVGGPSSNRQSRSKQLFKAAFGASAHSSGAETKPKRASSQFSGATRPSATSSPGAQNPLSLVDSGGTLKVSRKSVLEQANELAQRSKAQAGRWSGSNHQSASSDQGYALKSSSTFSSPVAAAAAAVGPVGPPPSKPSLNATRFHDPATDGLEQTADERTLDRRAASDVKTLNTRFSQRASCLKSFISPAVGLCNQTVRRPTRGNQANAERFHGNQYKM